MFSFINNEKTNEFRLFGLISSLFLLINTLFTLKSSFLSSFLFGLLFDLLFILLSCLLSSL